MRTLLLLPLALGCGTELEPLVGGFPEVPETPDPPPARASLADDLATPQILTLRPAASRVTLAATHQLGAPVAGEVELVPVAGELRLSAIGETLVAGRLTSTFADVEVPDAVLAGGAVLSALAIEVRPLRGRAEWTGDDDSYLATTGKLALEWSLARGGEAAPLAPIRRELPVEVSVHRDAGGGLEAHVEIHARGPFFTAGELFTLSDLSAWLVFTDGESPVDEVDLADPL